MSRKHPAFIIRQQTPLNGGPPPDLMCQSFCTPNELFFTRNHAPTPQIDLASYRLTVTGLVERQLSLTFDELKNSFPRMTVTATLQCAGNRRDEMAAVAPIPAEVPWGAEAISNGLWAGVRLGDVLRAAAVMAAAGHAAFTGLDQVERRGQTFGFGGSVPLDKAMAPETLLAYEMNTEVLPPVHGFPLRAMVPGYIGARSVKWLSNINLQREPSDNDFQAHSYKLFPPQTTAETADWPSGLMLGELPVTAVICAPASGEVAAGPTLVQGYAMAGGDRHIERVDVSVNGGQTWTSAGLSPARWRWVWQLWQATLDLPAGRHQLVARAWDSAANTQPESVAPLWNFKGYMNNAWHRVEVRAK